jgi:hypothetical protein
MNASQFRDRAGARKAFRQKASAAAKQSLESEQAHNTRQRRLLARLLAKLAPATADGSATEKK